MKRYLLIMLLLGILFGILYAEKDQEKVYLSLFDAREYSLNMSMSTDANRLYSNVQFSVDSAHLQPAENYCFFLSKSNMLERIKLNGKSVPFSYVSGLDARHFEPRLENEALLSAEAPAYLISIDKKYLQQESGEIRVYIEYRSFLPAWTQDEGGREYLRWDTADFIYPKNVLSPAVLNLEFSCIPYFSLENAESTDDRAGIRRMKMQLLEKPDSGNIIKVYKTLN